jgi:hypothetical protein
MQPNAPAPGVDGPGAPRGPRPSGLTALAWINLGLGVLHLGWAALSIAFVRAFAGWGKREPAPYVIVWILLTLACGVLLLLSWAGYLRRARLLGRALGLLYAVTSLVGTALVPWLAGAPLSPALVIAIVVLVVYPLVTLWLIGVRLYAAFDA